MTNGEEDDVQNGQDIRDGERRLRKGDIVSDLRLFYARSILPSPLVVVVRKEVQDEWHAHVDDGQDDGRLHNCVPLVRFLRH